MCARQLISRWPLFPAELSRRFIGQRRKCNPPKLLLVNFQHIQGWLHLPVCSTGVARQPLQKGINFGWSEVSSPPVPLELVEELMQPVSLEGMLLFFQAECFEQLEVALGPSGIRVKWSHRRNCWVSSISDIPLDGYCIYPAPR